MNGTRQLPTPEGVGLLLVSPMSVDMDSSDRNDWLVDFPCEGQRAIDYFTPRQPDFSRRLDAFIPSPHGEHAAETNVFLRTVHLNRLSPQGSAFPFQGVDRYSSLENVRRFPLREVRVSHG